MSRAALIYAVILAGGMLWCALIVLAPLLAAAGGGAAEWAGVLYDGFHRVCHQVDNRSLHLFGEPLAVCSRCTAIYGAFLLGTIAYPFVRRLHQPRQPSRMLLCAALAPMVIDVLLGLSGLHESGSSTRLVTGSIFGLLIPFVVLPVVFGAVVTETPLSPDTHTQSKGTLDG